MEGSEGPQPSLPQPPSHLPSDWQMNEELRAKIVRQVEFYFSDTNLPTDDFLMKIIRRPGNPNGWVPIKTIASFHKMKKLTKNIQTIVAALRTSTELEVSPEDQSVRRSAPFDLNVDLEDIRSKTVITWNLPEKPTIEYVIELFSTVGTVEMARIRKTEHSEPFLTRGIKIEVGKNARDCYALIEYQTREDAIKAAEKLHDESNWRSGLRVRLLVPQPETVTEVDAEGAVGMAKKAGKKKKVPSTAAGVAAADGSSNRVEPIEEVKERPKPAWACSGKASVKLQRDRSSADARSSGAGNASVNTTDSAISNKAGSNSGTTIETQPKMPDSGSRGFGMGRGTVPQANTLFKLLSLSEKTNANTAAVAAPGSLVNSSD